MNPLKDQPQNRMISNASAISYIQLCQASDAHDLQDIPARVRKVKPLSEEGYWSCIWGPSTDEDESNLAYVAAYFEAHSHVPVLAAVVLRGTNADVPHVWDIWDAWGVLHQMFENFFVLFQSHLPWLPDSSVRVADGALDGLWAIQGLESKGQSLKDFLIHYLSAPANMRPQLYVTGHSLGGCLASVAALWLKDALGKANVSNPIIPVTFAAPTAGNAAFAEHFTAVFPHGAHYVNTLDSVAYAWSNLDALKDIYGQCGIALPDPISWSIWMFKEALEITGATYAQPPGNRVRLPGNCWEKNPGHDWYSEASYQHRTETYLNLLNGPTLTTERLTPAFPRRNRRRPGAPVFLPPPHCPIR